MNIHNKWQDKSLVLEDGTIYTTQELLKLFFALITIVARTVGCTLEDIEDTISKIFLESNINNKSFKNNNALKSYIIICIRHQCLATIRDRNYRRNIQQLIKYVQEKEEKGYTDLRESEKAKQQLLIKVYKAINRLPTRCRKIFILIYLKQLSRKDIATSLKISTHTVKKQRDIAIRLLRKFLSE